MSGVKDFGQFWGKRDRTRVRDGCTFGVTLEDLGFGIDRPDCRFAGEKKSRSEKNKEQAVEMTTEEWLAIRKEAGLGIDPETAKVCWSYGQVADPYDVFPEPAKDG